MGCGGGQQTTTSVSKPPPEVMEAYKAIGARAFEQADKGFIPYERDLVAPLNQRQMEAIRGFGGAQDIYEPYIDASGRYIDRGFNIAHRAPNVRRHINPYAEEAERYATNRGANIARQGRRAGRDISRTAKGIARAAPGIEGYSAEAIEGMLSPYTENVIDTSLARIREEEARAHNELTASAILGGGGAFGGDRAGIAAAELAEGQQRARDETIAQLYERGHTQAVDQFNREQARAMEGARIGLEGTRAGAETGLGAAQYGTTTGLKGIGMGQQGYGQSQALAGAHQQMMSDAAARAASQQAGLGGQELQSYLTAQQAQLLGGSLQQAQRQRVLDTNYQQFLAEQAHPWQSIAFLSNNLLGTAPVLGGQTTTTAPAPSSGGQIMGSALGLIGGLFGLSDERAKEDEEQVGELFDGTPVYRFRYKGEPGYHIGLLAQDIERRNPEAVGETIEGIKGVDYFEATEPSAGLASAEEMPKRDYGGVVPGPLTYADKLPYTMYADPLTLGRVPDTGPPRIIGGMGPPSPPGAPPKSSGGMSLGNIMKQAKSISSPSVKTAMQGLAGKEMNVMLKGQQQNQPMAGGPLDITPPAQAPLPSPGGPPPIPTPRPTPPPQNFAMSAAGFPALPFAKGGAVPGEDDDEEMMIGPEEGPGSLRDIAGAVAGPLAVPGGGSGAAAPAGLPLVSGPEPWTGLFSGKQGGRVPSRQFGGGIDPFVGALPIMFEDRFVEPPPIDFPAWAAGLAGGDIPPELAPIDPGEGFGPSEASAPQRDEPDPPPLPRPRPSLSAAEDVPDIDMAEIMRSQGSGDDPLPYPVMDAPGGGLPGGLARASAPGGGGTDLPSAARRIGQGAAGLAGSVGDMVTGLGRNFGRGVGDIADTVMGGGSSVPMPTARPVSHSPDPGGYDPILGSPSEPSGPVPEDARMAGMDRRPVPPLPIKMTPDERNALGLIEKYESRGQNVMNYMGRRQGLSPTTPKGYTAQGYFQILNSNWQRLAPGLGIEAPNAMAASREDQARVALALMRESGLGNWTKYNPALRSAMARGERAPLQLPSAASAAPAPQPRPGLGEAAGPKINNVEEKRSPLAALNPFGDSDPEAKKFWRAVSAAGFAMAASRNPSFFGALGEGGLAGLAAYSNMESQKDAKPQILRDGPTVQLLYPGQKPIDTGIPTMRAYEKERLEIERQKAAKGVSERSSTVERIASDLQESTEGLSREDALKRAQRIIRGGSGASRREAANQAEKDAAARGFTGEERERYKQQRYEYWVKRFLPQAPSIAPAAKAPGPQAKPGAAKPDLKPMPPKVAADARDAIDRGASREAVIQRLQENGYDPSGL